jgi:aryl-alcohol dehydrogenase-like predicted oxidoreductase
MPLDNYVTLGRSGLAVSPFCLGAMTFGEDWGWGASVKESEAIIDKYLDEGGNFIDTANIYTRGHSEKIIGDHLGRYPARRERVVIATKFFSNLFPGDPNAGGTSRKSIIAACDESLRRLQTDYIDLYLMHGWDRFTPIDETLRALDDLVGAGKARYLGFSDTPAWKVAQAQVTAHFRGWAPLIALQIEYSLLERTVEGELIPMAQELGLGVTPWSPLRYGVLSGKYSRAQRTVQSKRGEWITAALTDHALNVLDVVLKVAEELGTTPARVALAWLQSRPSVVSTIIGARTVAQLEDNLGALEVSLSPEHIAALEEISRPVPAFPMSYLPAFESFARGGSTLNGESFEPPALLPTSDQQRY